MSFGGWIPDEAYDYSLLKTNARLLDSVSVCAFGIERDGSLRDSIEAPQTEFMKWARGRGIAVWATIAGVRGSLPGGIEGAAGERCVGELAAACAMYELAGIDVDIEGIPGSARGTYTRFIANLASVLHGMNPPRRVAATVMDFPSAADEATGPFDYAALAGIADEVRVMLYDYSTSSPGPIMPREYFADDLAFARSRIPAAKFVAALPWYGRDWNTRERTTEDLTCLADAGDLPPGACPEWREPEGELTLSFTRDGKRHVVWLPDARKFEWMVDEVRKAGASGIYVWHLGCASREFLQVVRSEVRRRKV